MTPSPPHSSPHTLRHSPCTLSPQMSVSVRGCWRIRKRTVLRRSTTPVPGVVQNFDRCAHVCFTSYTPSLIASLLFGASSRGHEASPLLSPLAGPHTSSRRSTHWPRNWPRQRPWPVHPRMATDARPELHAGMPVRKHIWGHGPRGHQHLLLLGYMQHPRAWLRCGVGGSVVGGAGKIERVQLLQMLIRKEAWQDILPHWHKNHDEEGKRYASDSGPRDAVADEETC